MSLFYITGISGSGKSQVLKELQAKGYQVHGTDEHGYAHWLNTKTSKVEVLPENQPGFDIHKWFAEHDWILDYEKITQLKKQTDTSNKPAFLCGLADGYEKVWDLFAKVFLLVIDEPTIRQRIAERTDNDFGKSPEEMNDILKWHSKNERLYKDLGAIPIDAKQPLTKVVDNIVSNLLN